MAPRRTPAKGNGDPKTSVTHRIAEGLLPMSLILAPKSSKELYEFPRLKRPVRDLELYMVNEVY